MTFSNINPVSGAIQTPQVVFSNQTLASNDFAIVTGDFTGLNVQINIQQIPTGVNPGIQFFIQDLDPSDSFTPIGSVISSPVLSGVGNTTVVFNPSFSGVVKIRWALTGSLPSFPGVFVSVVPNSRLVINTSKTVVHNGAALTTSGFSFINTISVSREVDVFINIIDFPVETTPTLQFIVYAIDPGDQNTIISTVASGTVITSPGTQRLTFTNSGFNLFKLVWNIGGNARFTNVFTTVLVKTFISTTGSGSGTFVFDESISPKLLNFNTIGTYREILPAAVLFPTSVTWWDSSAKNKKVAEKLFTYDTIKRITTINYKVYDTNGALLTTITDTFAYSGNTFFETSRTRAIT